MSAPDGTRPMLEARDLSKVYKRGGGLPWQPAEPIVAVRQISLSVRAGTVLSLIGESGSGKSTLARMLMKLIEPTTGSVTFEGMSHAERRGASLVALRRQIQLVQQDARGSLDPRMKVGNQLVEPLEIHGIGDARSRRHERDLLLEQVGLEPAIAERLPHMLSGGQRQRIVIARALALKPTLLICDEPVSSLDMTVQARIIDLLLRLKQQAGLTMMFVTHDLSLAARISDDIAVLKDGEIVESGRAVDVMTGARSAYTASLIEASMPRRTRKRVPAPLVAAGKDL